MIRFVRTIKFQQLPVLLQQLRFVIFFGQGAGLFRRRYRVVKASGLRISCRQGADQERHMVVRQLAGEFSELNGARSIPDIGFFAGSQCPRQIVQIDGQKA